MRGVSGNAVCSAQVTHALNLGAESKVALTAPTAKFEYLHAETRRFVWYHRVRMPRQLLAQAFGLWHSGKLRTARRERPSRVASVRQDGNWPFPDAHHLTGLKELDNVGHHAAWCGQPSFR
jgi:hypothetical protein